MKKIFTLFTTIMIFLSMSLQCYATDLSSSGSVQRVHILEAADSSVRQHIVGGVNSTLV